MLARLADIEIPCMAYEKDWFVSPGKYGKIIGRDVEFTTLEYVKFVDSEESESVTSIKSG